MKRAHSPQRRRWSRGAALAITAAAIGPSCSTSPPPPARSAEAPTLPAPPPAAPRYLRVGLTADLSLCEASAPHFFHDVDQPRPQDHVELRALANCLSSEPYRELDLMLVGRADHVGDTAYNEDLARRRAQHVADVLAAHGVAPRRLVVVSRGEADAIGHEHELATLGYDRRVDILVMNPVSPGHAARPVHHPDAPE